MTLAEAWKLFQEAMPALALLGSVAVLVLGTRFVMHKQCAQHRETFQAGMDESAASLKENAARRRELETAIRGLPTKRDLEDMHKTLSALMTQVSVLQEALNGQRALFQRLEGQVDRIDTFLKGLSHI